MCENDTRQNIDKRAKEKRKRQTESEQRRYRKEERNR